MESVELVIGGFVSVAKGAKNPDDDVVSWDVVAPAGPGLTKLHC